MNKIKIFIKIEMLSFGLLLLIVSNPVIAQIRYEISLNAGESNLFESNHSYLYDDEGYRIRNMYEYNLSNYFTYNSTFQLECLISESIRDSKVSLEQGLMFETVSYYFNIPEIIFANDTIHSNKWEERFWSLGIPLRIRYGFENWLEFYVGVNNIFHVYENNDILYSAPLAYTLRGECGADFIFFRKFILGAKYSHDITPFSKLNNYDVSYRFEIVSLKMGYRF
jgi:hypothetical protein